MLNLRHMDMIYQKPIENAGKDLADIIDNINAKQLRAGQEGLKYIYLDNDSGYLQNVLGAISRRRVQNAPITITRLPRDTNIPWCCEHNPHYQMTEN